jgi:hypothetical protein
LTGWLGADLSPPKTKKPGDLPGFPLEAYRILLLVLLAWLLGVITLLPALTGVLRLLAWLLGMITLLSALTTLLATLVLLAALVLV